MHFGSRLGQNLFSCFWWWRQVLKSHFPFSLKVNIPDFMSVMANTIIYCVSHEHTMTEFSIWVKCSIHFRCANQWTLKLQHLTFGALVVNKQNCMRLAEEHCSRSTFSLFMSMMWFQGKTKTRFGQWSHDVLTHFIICVPEFNMGNPLFSWACYWPWLSVPVDCITKPVTCFQRGTEYLEIPLAKVYSITSKSTTVRCLLLK